MPNSFENTIAALETQFGEAMRIVRENGDLDQIERVGDLIILKEKLIEALIDELCDAEDTTFENPDEIIINGNAEGPATPYPSNITVSDLDGAVRHVTVTLYGLTHTWPDDLDILLVGPQGQSVVLMSDAGGSTNINNVTLEFDDNAADFLPDSSGIVSGTYKPTNYEGVEVFPAPAPGPPYGSTLSVFNGTDPNGTWSLYVFDDSAFDNGSIAEGWDLTITTNPCVGVQEPAPGVDQVEPDDINSAVFHLESELSRAFQVILDAGNPNQIERFLKLLINKELLLLMIVEEIDENGNGNGNGGNGDECPCKFRLGIQGNSAPTTVFVSQPSQPNSSFTGTINVSAEQCFTGARMCNPSVDQFNINFGDNGTTINFTQGRRTLISCVDGTEANLLGTAQATGNLLSGDFNVSIEFTDNQNGTGTWVINATSFDESTTFFTTFTAPVSARTFIGDCSENVGPN
ncbi:proprotein convertase P-domain-containing protein [Lederbergia graminis]|uniref:Proprotein convertase P-domain-containing protein n=1 Tax=Lederbergia graminis TaxID=735518 RepID=A0ABW0LFN6_9BACI|nr:proprotein convertase P-domain-containing protein [Paenibacillus bovis]